jgi:hypothetical protein
MSEVRTHSAEVRLTLCVDSSVRVCTIRSHVPTHPSVWAHASASRRRLLGNFVPWTVFFRCPNEISCTLTHDWDTVFRNGCLSSAWDRLRIADHGISEQRRLVVRTRSEVSTQSEDLSTSTLPAVKLRACLPRALDMMLTHNSTKCPATKSCRSRYPSGTG